MVEPWILLSIMAAFFQTLRFMLQKSLSMGTLSALGATFARFAYAAPMAALLAGGMRRGPGWGCRRWANVSGSTC
ncbi:hypothetical protein [Roseovarius sp. C03]|uniref:hypothetical protein n=1 Tax=Roseovarius sp. C03 TaxID=3449222 RepID=UPI003EDC5A3E